jgi:hypothetical protein
MPIEKMQQQVIKERDRTRLANRPSTEPCPLCFETVELSPQRDGVTHCKKCQTFYVTKWDAANSKTYCWGSGDTNLVHYRKHTDPVPIHDMTSPVPGVPIDWCMMCGSVFPKDSLRNYNGFVVCFECNAIDPLT